MTVHAKPQAAWSQASICLACAKLAAAIADREARFEDVMQAAREELPGHAESLAHSRARDAEEAAEQAVIRAAMAWWTGHHAI